MKKQLLIETSQIETRLVKLVDVYVDEIFDKETYLAKKEWAIIKRKEIEEKLE